MTQPRESGGEGRLQGYPSAPDTSQVWRSERSTAQPATQVAVRWRRRAQMLGLYVIMGAAGILAFIWAICSVW